MRRFFSNGTWRPRLRAIEEVPTPIGECCVACGGRIQIDHCGVALMHADAEGEEYRPWHLACFRRAIGIEDGAA